MNLYSMSFGSCIFPASDPPKTYLQNRTRVFLLDISSGVGEAISAASDEAKRVGRRCCLNTPDSKNYWFDEKGNIECTSIGPGPYMQRFRLNGDKSCQD